MEYVADLHLHSKYSRAVSQAMVLENIADWAGKKGIDILAAPDWTHPLWFKEMKSQLTEAYEGLYKLKNGSAALFLLSTEIASIYSQNGKLRRIHNLVFVPNLETAEKVSRELLRRGCNLLSDGRPIVGISSRNLLEILLSIDKKIILIPAHVWTPHFGIYGSASGFETLAEAFGDLSKYIYGIETGISSDPFMNWQIPELETRSILSFSDAHSAPKMAREATIFSLPQPSYMNLGKAISRRDTSCQVSSTIEFYPEEGKYHFTGHRNCGISLSPDQVKEKGVICPVCQRKLTEGVMIRVQQVAGREISTDEPIPQPDKNGVNWIKDPKNNHPPFIKLVPLLEIIAESLNSTTNGIRVKETFDEVCSKLGSEINVLVNVPLLDIKNSFGVRLAEGIEKVRKGDIVIEPGFDGEYGKVKIWKEEEVEVRKQEEKSQLGLF